ncbi:MAG: 23S rRNA (cytosine(1962)-C(5))-methyltransferase RlmI, partial [Chloroflexales bacterium]
MASITLRTGRERPLQMRHPWIFSGAIGAVRGSPAGGEAVEIHSASGEWLARGFYSGESQIRVRVATWDSEQPLDTPWLRTAIERAVAGRAGLADGPDGACRMVFSEADGLPGLIVDRYGPYLSVQMLTQAMAVRADAVTVALAELFDPRGIYERSDADVREKEGLLSHEGLLWGEPPPERL